VRLKTLTLLTGYAVAAKSKFRKIAQAETVRGRKFCYVSRWQQDVNGIEKYPAMTFRLPNVSVSPRGGAPPILLYVMHIPCAYLPTLCTWQRVHFHLKVPDSPLFMGFSPRWHVSCEWIRAEISTVAICTYISPGSNQ
jgi:hypothetical protein